jgi:hypothetical protein
MNTAPAPSRQDTTSPRWLSLKKRVSRIDFRGRGHRLLTPLLALSLLFVAVGPLGTSASASGSGVIQGTVFQDLNRNGVQDAEETGLANVQLYLFDGGGQYLGVVYSGASGDYQFGGLADGTYRVQFASPSWWSLRNAWVPTTTGSLLPRVTVSLAGSATADFGWRPIVRSSDITAPISSYTGANGLRVQSYDDVVPAKEIYDAVMRGAVGPEAQYVTIRFDFSPTSTTAASWQGSPGTYSNFQAACYDNYVSWLDQGDVGVSHEYGHAWTLYYDTVVQQEGTFDSYLKARGLSGDPRLGSSEAWNLKEIVAEDYRQLLGSPTARAAPQMNRDIPSAADVSGLRDFFMSTLTTPPAVLPPPAPPAVAVAAPVVNPKPVTKSGTISTSVSAAAQVTIEVRNGNGQLVRTLLSAVGRPAGGVSVVWDRKDSSGRRVKPGTYSASVRAVTPGGSASASSGFAVS